jgi:ferredoxin--NADP+ reductase
MATIIERKRLAPNIHLLELDAPDIARAARPGQFVMVMPDGRGERIPLTLADWDAAAGRISCVFQPVGTSTHKLSLLGPGDDVPSVCGPLGRPSEIAAFGTVLLAAGCFGLAAIHPIARALKAAGNRVVILAVVKAA